MTDSKLYLSRGFGSLIRGDYAKLEIKFFENFGDWASALSQSVIIFHCIEVWN